MAGICYQRLIVMTLWRVAGDACQSPQWESSVSSELREAAFVDANPNPRSLAPAQRKPKLAQPIGVFKPIYRAALAKGLRLKAHVGEWGTADDVWQAVEELGLDEVQHGIAAAQSPAVMRFLAEHHIRLNICPTSNVMLGRVDSIANHPIRALYDAGVIITVNTDDVLMFGSSVSDEYFRIYSACVFSAAELNQIRLNGLTDPVVAR